MSETMTAPAPAAALEVTDALGRKLTIRKLDILKELDLIEGAGKASENSRWMMLATLAACVASIDGVPCPSPVTRQQIRAQVALVKSEGIDAVASAFNEDVPSDGDTGAVEATAKN